MSFSFPPPPQRVKLDEFHKYFLNQLIKVDSLSLLEWEQTSDWLKHSHDQCIFVFLEVALSIEFKNKS